MPAIKQEQNEGVIVGFLKGDIHNHSHSQYPSYSPSLLYHNTYQEV